MNCLKKGKLPQLSRKLEMAEKLFRIRIDDRFEIVIGRKASENDFITTQLADLTIGGFILVFIMVRISF